METNDLNTAYNKGYMDGLRLALSMVRTIANRTAGGSGYQLAQAEVANEIADAVQREIEK